MVSSNSPSVTLLAEHPVLRAGRISLGCQSRCVLNAAARLTSKLPVFPTTATASLQLGHQPRTPPHSPVTEPRIRFTSVHLVVWLSLLPRSDYPSAGHQRLHLEGTSKALRMKSSLLKFAVHGPPDPVFFYGSGWIFFNTGHCSHPSPSSTLPETPSRLCPCPVL